MRVIKHSGKISLVVTTEEKEIFSNLFTQVGKNLPTLPVDISKETGREDDAYIERQEMLEAALKEQREDNFKHIAAWIADLSRWKKNPDKVHWAWSLTLDEAERFLSYLNELRIGAWMLLGKPEDMEIENLQPSRERLPWISLLFTSGMLQEVICEAIWE